MPQVVFFYNSLVDWHSLSTLQIKNIKLHIATDIKVVTDIETESTHKAVGG